MTAVLIAVIAAVAVVLTVGSARRALAERDAVERHHRTLDALGTLSRRTGVPVAPLAPPTGEYHPRHRRARSRRPVSAARVAAVAGAMAVAAAGGWFLVGRPRGRPGPRQAAPGTATTTGPASTTTAATGTGAPSGPSVVLVSSDNQQAHYRLDRPAVDVELVPTAACWVEIRTALGATPVVFVGTLRPGSRRIVPTGAATGGVSVRLGNPAGMSVSVDGTTLALPRPSGTTPFTLVFQPSG